MWDRVANVGAPSQSPVGRGAKKEPELSKVLLYTESPPSALRVYQLTKRLCFTHRSNPSWGQFIRRSFRPGQPRPSSTSSQCLSPNHLPSESSLLLEARQAAVLDRLISSHHYGASIDPADRNRPFGRHDCFACKLDKLYGHESS